MAEPRTKSITFRVSEAEHEQLQAAADEQGYESLSDMCRVVMLASTSAHSLPRDSQLILGAIQALSTNVQGYIETQYHNRPQLIEDMKAEWTATEYEADALAHEFIAKQKRRKPKK